MSIRCETRRALLTSNSPAVAIVEYAGRERIDLIVTGTTRPRRRGTSADGQRRRTRGSDRAVPVLTVRHPEHEFVIPDALVAVAKA